MKTTAKDQDLYNPEEWRSVHLGRRVKDEELGREALEKSTRKMVSDIQRRTGYEYSGAEIEFCAIRDLWEKVCGDGSRG